MAGRRKPEAVPVTTALVASAVRYGGKAARIYQPNQDWQKECYRHVGICGEARFAARFFGHAMAKAVLAVGVRQADGSIEPSKGGAGVAALEDLFNGAQGQAQMLEAIGYHLTVAGECYLIGRTVKDEEEGVEVGGEVWEVVSVLEVKVTGEQWSIVQDGTKRRQIDLTEDDVVIRIWQPKPEKRIEADSAFRSLLPVLSEIEWVTRHIYAQVSSRLAGAGILFVPQGMSFPAPPPVDGEKVAPEGNEAAGFIRVLGQNMLAPIEDASNPAALVPVVASVPDGTTDSVKHLTFWSELDAQSLEMRREAVRRFATGMDLPPEQVLGMSSNPGTGGGNTNGVSHWGAWQIEEATIKMHIEPMLGLVCNALTVGYLRTQTTTDEVVYADTSALRLRPDRSKEALELFNLGQLSGEALLRENGFDVTDMPDEQEQRIWLLRKIATGSATPEQVQAALAILGVSLGIAAPTSEPAELPPPPSIEDHPVNPRTPSENAAVVAAAEALVLRALERAGNRLRNSPARPPNVAPHETHCLVKAKDPDYLLEDAWSTAPIVLDGLADHVAVVPVLDAYCRNLLTTQCEHSRGLLRNWLDRGVVR